MSWLSKIFGKDQSKPTERSQKGHRSGTSSETPMPSVEDVTFDTTNFELGGVHEHVRAWRNSDGDAVVLFCESGPPDYPVAKNMDEFFVAAVEKAKSNGVPLVEQYVCNLDGHRGLAYIMRCISDGRAVAYQGDISIPFKSHHFHFRIECKELGVTGARESKAMVDAHFEGRIQHGEDGQIVVEGDVNPDDKKYDEMFPTHPLSRIRELMKHVSSSVSTNEKLNKFEPYIWPKATG